MAKDPKELIQYGHCLICGAKQTTVPFFTKAVLDPWKYGPKRVIGQLCPDHQGASDKAISDALRVPVDSWRFRQAPEG